MEKGNEEKSYLGENFHFTGKISIHKGVFENYGTILGNIEGDTYVQENGGKTEGTLKVNHFINAGNFKGECFSKEAELRKGSLTKGLMMTEKLLKEKEAKVFLELKDGIEEKKEIEQEKSKESKMKK